MTTVTSFSVNNLEIQPITYQLLLPLSHSVNVSIVTLGMGVGNT